MNAFAVRKLVEFVASLLILIPAVLLLAWEPAITNIGLYWAILTICSGTFLVALFLGERRKGALSIRNFISKCGGFCLMFLFVLYQCFSLLLG